MNAYFNSGMTLAKAYQRGGVAAWYRGDFLTTALYNLADSWWRADPDWNYFREMGHFTLSDTNSP